MEKLDINALLEKNPGVDRDEVEAFIREEIADVKAGRSANGSASPYGGRRMIVDDQPRLTGNRAGRRWA